MENYFYSGNLVKSNRTIYTASSFAKSSLIYLQEIGNLTAVKPHISTRSNLSSYLFFVVTSGSGFLNYDNKNYNLKTGDCVFIDCKNKYSQSSSDELWSLKWIHFYGLNMDNIYKKYVEHGGLPHFSLIDFSKYEDIIDSIYEITNSNDFIRDMKINQHINSLLTYLMEENWTSLPSIDTRLNIHDIKNYIDMNFNKNITLDLLSSTFFINKFYLTKLFKKKVGKSINTYLLDFRITKSKEKLRFSQLTVSQIALQCGFNDANYFARIFKKYEGISPSEYRENWTT